jgi:glucokinase
MNPKSDNKLKGCALALDIGGTKVAAAIVSFNGDILGCARVTSPSTDNPDKYFQAVRYCAEDALKSAGVSPNELAGIGCGCGGPMRWPSGHVSPINIPTWRDFPLRDRLAETFDGKPVYVHNDAVALAAGEHWKGAGQKARNMIAVTISTGVGGGLILNQHLFHGYRNIGHLVVDPDGPECKCGAKGCLEAIASGPSAVHWALSQGWIPPHGDTADSTTLAQSANAGDSIASQTLARAGFAVGAALINCANLLDLRIAVLAGGFSQSGPFFWDAVHQSFSIRAKMDLYAKW